MLWVSIDWAARYRYTVFSAFPERFGQIIIHICLKLRLLQRMKKKKSIVQQFIKAGLTKQMVRLKKYSEYVSFDKMTLKTKRFLHTKMKTAL